MSIEQILLKEIESLKKWHSIEKGNTTHKIDHKLY
jgi:hypothetical protein